MLYKEIAVGFLLAGFIGLLGNDFFNGLFLTDAPGWLNALENVLVGPLIAVLSFVCSVGNIPLAAVLWSGGISFAGVMAFIFADLIVLPIIAIYRKYYGWPFTAADRRPDAADDDRRGARRRRPLQRRRPDPDHPAEPRGHLRLGRSSTTSWSSTWSRPASSPALMWLARRASGYRVECSAHAEGH